MGNLGLYLNVFGVGYFKRRFMAEFRWLHPFVFFPKLCLSRLCLTCTRLYDLVLGAWDCMKSRSILYGANQGAYVSILALTSTATNEIIRLSLHLQPSLTQEVMTIPTGMFTSRLSYGALQGDSCVLIAAMRAAVQCRRSKRSIKTQEAAAL